MLSDRQKEIERFLKTCSFSEYPYILACVANEMHTFEQKARQANDGRFKLMLDFVLGIFVDSSTKATKKQEDILHRLVRGSLGNVRFPAGLSDPRECEDIKEFYQKYVEPNYDYYTKKQEEE